MEGSVFCINNCNSPTFHGVVLALLTVNEVSYRMLWGCLFIQHLLEPYCVPQTQCRVNGTEPSERHKPGPNHTSVQKLAPVFTRCTPGMFHGLMWPCFPHLYKRMVKKEKKKGGDFPSCPVVKISPPTEKGTGSIPHPHNVEDYDALWRTIQVHLAPSRSLQRWGDKTSGETRLYIQPFPDLQCQGFLEEMTSRLRPPWTKKSWLDEGKSGEQVGQKGDIFHQCPRSRCRGIYRT